MKKLAKKVTKKVSKKVTKKVVVKRKTKKVITRKVSNKKNPSDFLNLPSFDSENGKYVLLTSFEVQFEREMRELGDRLYHSYDYEINNILKWHFGNSNLVGDGYINLMPLSKFKEIVTKSLTRTFETNQNIPRALNKTFRNISSNVKLIDTGN